MKKLIVLFIAATCCIGNAQEKNVFLDRDFWKSQPTVRDIRQKIKEGHDPAEKDAFAFDGAAYGIIDDAPLQSILFMLKQDGNPVNKPTHGGVSYLLWSAYKGNKALMEELIKLGADTQMTTTRGTNMLLMAAIGGVENTELYDLILAQNIPVDYTSENGANALLILSGADVKDFKIFDYFLEKGVPLSTVDNDGNNIFNYAARGGNLEIMKYWVSKGIPYKNFNAKGENGILFASQGMKRQTLRPEVFKYLSNDLKLDIDLVNWEGQTPLHLAARRATPELLTFFLENGVSAAQIDKKGNTALINAASGKLENVTLLYQTNNNINHQNKEGYSALTRAVQRGAKEIFNFLIENGANPKVIDANQNNLLFYAFDSYFERNKDNNLYVIDKLVALGVDPNQIFSNGNNLVHMAIEKESKLLLEKAIALGVNINQTNDLNLSPLHLAAMKAKNQELLDILLENGANKKLKTQFNESAYDLALENEILEKNEIDIGFLKID